MGKLFDNLNCQFGGNNNLILTQDLQKPSLEKSSEFYPVVKIKFTKLQPKYIKKNRRSSYSYVYP